MAGPSIDCKVSCNPFACVGAGLIFIAVCDRVRPVHAPVFWGTLTRVAEGSDQPVNVLVPRGGTAC